MNRFTLPAAGDAASTREIAPQATRYRPGFRPRCQVCQQELAPCPVLDHEYPQRVRYAGFHPCPTHSRAGVTYPMIPT
jgi:hypothetical protein